MTTTIKRILAPVAIQRSGLDHVARTVPVTLATDSPIPHGGRSIILRHGEDALDMAQLSDDGAPLLVSHNGHGLPIGRLKEIKMGDHETTAVAQFGRSETAESVFRDVRDGIITDVSVGADPVSPEDIRELDNGDLLVERWRIIEGSCVSVGADPRAKIHRSEGEKMTFELVTDEARTARTAELRRIFDGLDGGEFKTMHIEALESTDAVEIIRTKVLDKLKATSTTVQRAPSVQAGEDEGEKWLTGARASLLTRMGLADDDEKAISASSEFHGMTCMDLCRSYLRRQSRDVFGLDRQAVAQKALYTRGIVSHTTSDFASILADASNKALNMGYEEANTTWAEWTATGSLPDFKTAQFSNLSTFSDVDVVKEGAEYEYGSFDDKHETGQLATYGKLFSTSRSSIINDDLDAFSRIPTAIGRSQARKLNAAVYGLLNDNAAMNEDATTLFHANHGNLGTSSVIDEAALTEMDKLFALQNALGPDGGAQTGAVLNLVPAYLLVPRTIRITAIKETLAITDPVAVATAGTTAVNPHAGLYTIVSDQAMDANSAAVWYMAASPRAIDTIKVFFLDGQSSPVLEQQEGFTVDGVIWKSRFDWAAVVMDFRGLAKNAGV